MVWEILLVINIVPQKCVACYSDNEYRCCNSVKVNWGSGVTDWCTNLNTEWNLLNVSIISKNDGITPIYRKCKLSGIENLQVIENNESTGEIKTDTKLRIGYNGYYVEKTLEELKDINNGIKQNGQEFICQPETFGINCSQTPNNAICKLEILNCEYEDVDSVVGCEYDWQCRGEGVCQDYKCKYFYGEKSLFNETCSSDVDCATNNCGANGKCAYSKPSIKIKEESKKQSR